MSEKIDLFIPASPKDQVKLKHCIVQAAKHIPQCGDFVVSVPDKSSFEDYELDGHKVKFFNDFDLVPLHSWLPLCRFRPNWIAQQLLKLLQPATSGDLYFCIDADCFICKDMDLVEDGKPRLFVSPNSNDEGAFHRFIAKAAGGELCSWTDKQHCTTKYIADMQLFSRSHIARLIYKYFPNATEFVNFTVSNTYWRTDDTLHSIFISEYEMYGRWIEKFFRHEVIEHCIAKRQIDKIQMSQKESLWTDDEIAASIAEAEADGVEVLKLQSNAPLHDVGWAIPQAGSSKKDSCD